MQSVIRANTISTEHSGDLLIPADNKRSYFFIVMTSGSAGLEFGGGGGLVPLTEGAHYNPPIAPVGAIRVVTEGTYIVHMG